MSLIPRVIVRRWLESVLALVSIAMLYLNQHPEALPRALDLKNDTNLTLWDWIFRGMVFGLLGAEGSFGVKGSADRLLPDLLAPAGSSAR